jgi:hypothetical protein
MKVRNPRAKWLRVCMAGLLLLMSLAALAPAAHAQAPRTSVVEFRSAMRKLWEDHITWTRLYIISEAHSLPDKDVTAQRLLQNQTDIGNAVKPFYGEAAGNQLTALLRDHILGAVELLAAAKANDKPKLDAASAKWYANANDIADFLSAANPQAWPRDTMRAEMKMHLDVTLKEATDRLGGKYADDIRDYDEVHAHILKLADTLSTGIAAQFPDRFEQARSGEWPTRSAVRKLWEDHIQFTRFYIVSVAHNLPDKDATAARLLQNQVDIGNAVKPTFGAAAGDRLTALLREHILGAVALIDAAKAKDTAKVEAASKAWYANGDEIAAFLSGANPRSWPLDTMKMQMKMHLDLTLPEATNRLSGKYADDVKDYDKIHDHILAFADVLSAGLLAAAAPAAQAPTQLPRTGGLASGTGVALGLATAGLLLAAGAGLRIRRRPL